MEKLLIFYLSNNDRYFIFEKFILEIYKSKYLNNIFLLIVGTHGNFTDYEKYMNNTNLKSAYFNVDCPKSNYLPKVNFAIKYAIDNNFKYIFKCDNDIIIPIYTLDFIMENLNELNKEGVVSLSPTISTGIPSVEYFIEDLFNEEEVLKIRSEFKKCVFYDHPSICDYRPLNITSVDNPNNWNPNFYFSYLKNYTDTLQPNAKYYKGIHPIRHGFGNEYINELIIKNKEKFFSEKPCYIIKDENPYLCDMCFIIKTNVYDQIINKENLIIDGCDEVPLNRYVWNNNFKHLIIRNGLTIHITYNWRWDANSTCGFSNIDPPSTSLIEFEKNFIDKLFE